jgi:hypothetical protein
VKFRYSVNTVSDRDIQVPTAMMNAGNIRVKLQTKVEPKTDCNSLYMKLVCRNRTHQLVIDK